MGLPEQQIRLRQLVKQRIDAGEYSITELAAKIGIGQGSLSNYLRGAGISIALAERIRLPLGIGERDLLSDLPMSRRESAGFISLVAQRTAIFVPFIPSGLVQRNTGFKAAALNKLPSFASSQRRQEWTRFIGVEVDKTQAAFLRPLLKAKDEVVIDRYYQRIHPFHKKPRMLYAVNDEGVLRFAYVKEYPDCLCLIPPLLDSDHHHVYFKGNLRGTQLIVGRVCQGSGKL